MLDSLLIKNFRLFRNLRIPDLSRVNLFVGKNNSGKSALLEAAEIYSSNANLDVLLDLVLARDGNWESEITESSSVETSQPIENPLRSLFCGHHLPDVGADGIELGPVSGSERLFLRTQAYQRISENEVTRRVALGKESLKNGALSELVDVEIGLEVQEGDRSWYLAPNDVDSYFVRRRRNFGPSAREAKWVFQKVPAQNLSDSKVSLLWDKVHLTDLEPEVVSCLRLVHDNLVGVAFVGEGSQTSRIGPPRSRRVPIVRLKDSPERLPLKSMGDGISRLFQIGLALVNSQNGILLIDEFENGLHWTVQPRIWELIFRLSAKLNVQVFATTHSRDCITAFNSVWKTSPKLASFYRLDQDMRDGARATPYDVETLTDAVISEVEVR